MKPEIYVSVDVEADGPVPGLYSMLSFAAAAFLADGTSLGTFSVNLEFLKGASSDPATMEWWATQGVAWDLARANLEAPQIALPRFVEWVDKLPGKPCLVGYPITYDFMWLYYYMIRFAGRSPFSHSGLDIKTFAMSMMGTDYRNSTKKNMPKHWFSDAPHTHVSLDDAIEQGILFTNMLRIHRGGK